MRCKMLFQNGEGGMVAVLGSKVDIVEKILLENEDLKIQIANDNSEGQIVLSGKNDNLNKLVNFKIKKY